MSRKKPQVKFMTLSQLQKIIDNGFVGDPRIGYGFDYVDQVQEIQSRFWELSEKKREERFNKDMEQFEE